MPGKLYVKPKWMGDSVFHADASQGPISGIISVQIPAPFACLVTGATAAVG